MAPRAGGRESWGGAPFVPAGTVPPAARPVPAPYVQNPPRERDETPVRAPASYDAPVRSVQTYPSIPVPTYGQTPPAPAPAPPASRAPEPPKPTPIPTCDDPPATPAPATNLPHPPPRATVAPPPLPRPRARPRRARWPGKPPALGGPSGRPPWLIPAITGVVVIRLRGTTGGSSWPDGDPTLAWRRSRQHRRP